MACIGLFGTCGNSRWRDDFISCYEQRGIRFFNPQVPEGTWHPGLVADENRHFVEDDIILFPVTAETTGQGSLAEIGFSILNALRQNRMRFFIFLIEEGCLAPEATPAEIEGSVRSRQLVKKKLAKEAADHHNIFLVGSLAEMLDLSLRLHEVCAAYGSLQSAQEQSRDDSGS